ncbi:ABC transporter permease subunit [Roseovarius sp. ZX-A-9]|uniref:ABC transporter permease subunit n=1 Tax=Roseovarius sp. ZX-A-9 TaxID=3014783 RepID=UPI00232E6342|nr:ABC transporter permease subunit [Roseovarius sp. ZX-A-9]
MLFVLAVIGVLIAAVSVASKNISAQGMSAGFGFLERSTGFNIGFSVIEYSSNSSYGRLITVGIVNTVLLGTIGIVLANIVGLSVAMLRTASNESLRLLGAIYVETFRNVPLILQAIFWYSIVTNLPSPREAINPFAGVFLTSRGFFLPWINVHGWAIAIAMASIVAGLILSLWIGRSRRGAQIAVGRRKALRRGVWTVCGVVVVVALIQGRIPETSFVTVPQVKGLNFRGGISLPPEMSALMIAITLYGGAYISEIVRAGLQSVSRGQTEAAQSLGISAWHIFTRIRLPLAFRAVLPSLTNQYVWLFKATTLGIAVGYTDLFAVISVSINQSGQTFELIGILMLAFLIMNNAISFTFNQINRAIAIRGTQNRG